MSLRGVGENQTAITKKVGCVYKNSLKMYSVKLGEIW